MKIAMDKAVDPTGSDAGAGSAAKAPRTVVRRPRVKPDVADEARRIVEQRERCQNALMDYQAP